ncbi:hypothetical protein HOK00_10570 [bacterium]|jgi:hypothetical protein|nr:hypothetical protein [bacterium]
MPRPKNTLIYSRKAYNKDTKFAEIVETTALQARSQEEHADLIQEYYPKHTIEVLYTYEHGCMAIERTMSCRWDSSADAFAAYKKEDQLIKAIEDINKTLF